MNPILHNKKRPHVIVCGSILFNDEGLLRDKLDYYTFRFENPVILVRPDVGWDPQDGRKIGADYLGEVWAHKHKHLVKRFHLDRERYGDKAVSTRNQEMVQHATEGKGSGFLVAFWDGKAKGVKPIIDLAEFYDLKIKIVKY